MQLALINEIIFSISRKKSWCTWQKALIIVGIIVAVIVVAAVIVIPIYITRYLASRSYFVFVHQDKRIELLNVY